MESSWSRPMAGWHQGSSGGAVLGGLLAAAMVGLSQASSEGWKRVSASSVSRRMDFGASVQKP